MATDIKASDIVQNLKTPTKMPKVYSATPTTGYNLQGATSFNCLAFKKEGDNF